ncbi:MAG: phage tail tip lysozyme [Ruminococcus sp.]
MKKLNKTKALTRVIGGMLACTTMIMANQISAFAYTLETGTYIYSDTVSKEYYLDRYYYDSEVRDRAEYIWNFLRNHGFNEVSASAVIGNFMCETGNLDCSTYEGGVYDYSDGIGIAQWTTVDGGLGTGVHADLAQFAYENYGCYNYTPYPWESTYNTWVSNLDCQLSFFVSDSAHGNKDMTWYGYSSLAELPWDVEYLSDFASHDWLADAGWDTARAIKRATEVFCFRWEVASGDYSNIGDVRLPSALATYEYFTGYSAGELWY